MKQLCIWISLILAGIFLSPKSHAFVTQNDWQQHVKYEIQATLDTGLKRLSGQAKVRYHNHSPVALDRIVFELPQQLYRQQGLNAQGRLAGIESLTVVNANGSTYQVIETASFFDVILPKALAPNSYIDLILTWELQFVSRLHKVRPRGGYEQFSETEIVFGGAEWYPRVLGFDQQYGWDKIPFEGKGEFHQEVSDFDVQLTAPATFLVVASGALTNPQDVLSSIQQKALNSYNKKVKVPHFENNQGQKQWHFKARKQRDFTFVAGNNLVWESKTIQLSGGLTQLNVLYPNNGRWLWQKYGLDAIEHSVKFLDSNLAPFPFPQMTLVNIAGIGMEYPGFTFVGFRGPDSEGGNKPNFSRTDKYDVIGGTIHEVTHSYFPMLVNTNERREGFFDEGLVSYLSYLMEQAWSPDFQSFYGAPKSVIPVMQGTFSRPTELADRLYSKLDSHYHIPAAAWNILGKQIIGERKLLQLLNRFVVQKAHKRAYFSELVEHLNKHTDVDLRPFFFDWFESGGRVDMAVQSVKTNKKHTRITIANLGGIRMPVNVAIVLNSGVILDIPISYQDWIEGNGQHHLIDVPAGDEIIKIEIDGQEHSADVARNNNVWLPSPL